MSAARRLLAAGAAAACLALGPGAGPAPAQEACSDLHGCLGGLARETARIPGREAGRAGEERFAAARTGGETGERRNLFAAGSGSVAEDGDVPDPVDAGDVFRDCAECPEMVVVPAGEFEMGSPWSEEGRFDDEGPVHYVRIGYRLAVGRYEVTRGEFARFVSATGRETGSSCRVHDADAGEWEDRSGASWRSPGYSQGADHPVVCVSWDDAVAYARWLSREAGREYRLLSESEWEYAARAGTLTARYWGEGASGKCEYANAAAAETSFNWRDKSCSDGHAHTAPVGSFGANGWKLHDMLGNVWEWTQDCWNDGYDGAPADGGAWKTGECSRRVLRGGSWDFGLWFVRAALRGGYDSDSRSSILGFRVARTLAP